MKDPTIESLGEENPEFCVGALSNPIELSDKLFYFILNRKKVSGIRCTATGANAVNQMCKMVSITRARLLHKGIELHQTMHLLEQPGKRDGMLLPFIRINLYSKKEFLEDKELQKPIVMEQEDE